VQRFDFMARPVDADRTKLHCATRPAPAPRAVWYRDSWRVFETSTAGTGLFMTSLSDPAKKTWLVAGEAGTASLENAIATPLGIIASYTHVDPANGNVQRVFMRRINDEPPRGRSVRH